MIVRTLSQILKSENNVEGENWASRRFLTKKDGVGYSFTRTTIYPGTATEIEYKNHFEACYCVEGEGEVEILKPEAEKGVYPITPDSMYCLHKHDRHILRAKTKMILICVFKPALTGQEVHDEDGSYPVLDR